MDTRRFEAPRETLLLRIDGDQWAQLYACLSFAVKRAKHEAVAARVSGDRFAEALYSDQVRILGSIVEALEGSAWQPL